MKEERSVSGLGFVIALLALLAGAVLSISAHVSKWHEEYRQIHAKELKAEKE